MKNNNLDIGKMHIEIFLPPEQAEGNSVVIPKLPHGSNIVTIQNGNESLTGCDALITKSRDFSLGIKTADCAPICFSDGKTIGIAHIGWRGLCLGLLEKMLTHFETTTLDIYVAPFLHSFQIQKDFCYDQITQKFGERFFEQKNEGIFFNFEGAIRSLLPTRTMFDARGTTTELYFPSYRRDKTSERFVTVVSFRAS